MCLVECVEGVDTNGEDKELYIYIAAGMFEVKEKSLYHLYRNLKSGSAIIESYIISREVAERCLN